MRSLILRLVCGEDDSLGQLDAFLDCTSAEDGITQWFGRDIVGGLGRRKLRLLLDRDIAEINDKIVEVVNRVIGHPRFQKLEAAWRGIEWLVEGTASDPLAQVRVFHAQWTEVARDMERAIEFDQSHLYHLINYQEFGMPGGTPYGMIVADYEFQHKPSPDHRTDDIAIMRSLAQVAAASFCPIISSVSPILFGVDRFSELNRRREIAATFRQQEYARFRSLQDMPDARFLGFAVPRILIRPPYRGRAIADSGLIYQEESDNPGGDVHLWVSAAFAFAQVVLRAFMDYRWMAFIRGTPVGSIAGGVVSGLEVADFETDAPGVAPKPYTEIAFGDRLERDLNEQGIMCLRPCPYTVHSAFYNVPSVQLPKTYDTVIANTNARMGTMLNYIICASRFAHYVKIIARDWVGSYTSAAECEDRLQRWINKFCTANEQASFREKAKYPLREARIIVRDNVGKPGSYSCSVALRPHFQLDQVISEFQLVTELENKGNLS